MTIGRKIGMGFALVIAVLIAIGAMTFLGLNGVVEKAQDVIWGNRMIAELTRKELDHLGWLSQVSGFFAQSETDIAHLDAEAGKRKTGLESWVSSRERQEFEQRIPRVQPLLKELEDLDGKVREALSRMVQTYKRPHPGLIARVQGLRDQLDILANKTGHVIEQEASGIYSKKNLLRDVVQQGAAVLEACEREPSLGTLEERQMIAMAIIKNLRYGPEGKDYFWIIDKQSRMVMHPYHPEFMGEDLSDYLDPKGRRIFKTMAEIDSESGPRFLLYESPVYEMEETGPMFACVRYFDPWYWIIGTGLYLEPKDTNLLNRVEAFVEKMPMKSATGIQNEHGKFRQFFEGDEIEALSLNSSGLKMHLEAARPHYSRYREAQARIIGLLGETDISEARKVFQTELMPAKRDLDRALAGSLAEEMKIQEKADQGKAIFSQEIEPASKAIAHLFQEMQKRCREQLPTDNDLLRSALSVKGRIGVVLGIALFLSLAIAWFIARTVVSILSDISRSMNRAKDEVVSAASLVADSSQEVAKGASDQGTFIEETAASLEEMTSLTRNNAQKAVEVNGIMRATSSLTKKAGGAVDHLTRSIGEISEASEASRKIVETINKIALETDFLALNAAIEAGKVEQTVKVEGFGVVAGEVRRLASETAAAAKNAGNLIETTIDKVNGGAQLMREVKAAFNQVQESAAKAEILVSEIASASKEQADGIDLINRAVLEMDKVVQQNVATAEETASASSQMEAQAERMKGIVDGLVNQVRGPGKAESAGQGQKCLKADLADFDRQE